MRENTGSHVNIIQAVIGINQSPDIRRRKNKDIGAFRYFDIDLPRIFHHGFPTHWEIAVLSDESTDDRSVRPDRVLIDAEALIESKGQSESDIPLIIVSNRHNVHLCDNLPRKHTKAFYIDFPEISQRPKKSLHPSLTPIVMAIKKKLDRKDIPVLVFTPYVTDIPAEDWRFFGRQKELDNLLYSPRNFVIVGARQIGKTSLMKEAERRLQKAGHKTYFVDLQDCSDESQLFWRILSELDEKEAANVQRRMKVFTQDRALHTVLKRMRGKGNGVLFLDELGNVIKKLPKEQWRVIGTLRQFAQAGGLKVIASCFQEFFLKQQEDFEGPFVNFATPMRLGAFSTEDVKELVLGPLNIWRPIEDTEKLLDLVKYSVGSHPVLLQYFCIALFDRLMKSDVVDILGYAKSIVDGENIEALSEPVESVFYKIPSATLRYLFVKRCQEIDKQNNVLIQSFIDDNWVKKTLTELGYQSSTANRRNLMEGLEVRGLTEPHQGNHGQQRIITPIVYRYLKRTEPSLEQYLNNLEVDIRIDHENWGLIAA